MKKTPKRGDSAQRAFQVVREATSEDEPTTPTDERIVEGARNGGNARASKLTPEQRSEIAKMAAASRWRKKTS
ncbi:MAG TPA: hypothetical protein VIJ86_08240 [Acidimicrobiales bacterium]